MSAAILVAGLAAASAQSAGEAHDPLRGSAALRPHGQAPRNGRASDRAIFDRALIKGRSRSSEQDRRDGFASDRAIFDRALTEGHRRHPKPLIEPGRRDVTTAGSSTAHVRLQHPEREPRDGLMSHAAPVRHAAHRRPHEFTRPGGPGTVPEIMGSASERELAAARKSKSHDTRSHDTKSHDSKSHDTSSHDHETKSHETGSHESKPHESRSRGSKSHETRSHKSKPHRTRSHESKSGTSKSHDRKLHGEGARHKEGIPGPSSAPPPAYGEAHRAAVPTGPASRGPDRITRVQEALNQQGFDIGTPDGKLGQRTVDAVKAFQKKRGFRTTGKLDHATVDAILAVAAAPATTPDGTPTAPSSPGDATPSFQLPGQGGLPVPGGQMIPPDPTTSGQGDAAPIGRVPAEVPGTPPSAGERVPSGSPQDDTLVPPGR